MPHLLQAAIFYASLGWNVFPLKPLAKTPATPRGFYDATTQTSQIRRWWETNPHYNIGVRTGGRARGDEGTSRGIYVLDVDPRNGGANSLDRLVAIHGDGWLHTLHCATGGGGSHYYYSCPESVRQCNTDLWKGSLTQGIDLKGSGGYVVAPPSVTTGRYQWAEGAWRSGGNAREIPPFILGTLEERHKEKVQRPPLAQGLPLSQQSHEKYSVNSPSFPHKLLEGAPQGTRNSTAASLAGYLWRKFGDKSIVTNLMNTWNQKNSPPLTQHELTTVINSVSRYHV